MSEPDAPRQSPSPRWESVGFWLYTLHLLTVFGLALSNVFLGLALLFAPRTARWREAWPRLKWALLPVGVYLWLLAASVAASRDPRASFGSLGEVILLGTFYLAVVSLVDETKVRRVVSGLIAVGALAAAYGLVQLFVGYGSLDRRIRGPFSHYMTFAGVLLLCNFLLLARMSCARRHRFLDWAAVALINGALLGSLTRSSWVATFVALVLLVVLSGRLNLVRALAGAAVLAAVLAPISLVQRVLSIGDPHDLSNYDRLCMVDAGLEMIADHPLFGIGPGLVKEIYPLYRHPTAPRYRVPHLHNTFLQLGAERGLASLTAYLGMMAVAIGLALRRYRAEGGRAGPRADLYLGVVLALVAFNLAGLFEDNWDDSEVQRVALFVMAIPFCLGGSPPAPSLDDRQDVSCGSESPS